MKKILFLSKKTMQTFMIIILIFVAIFLIILIITTFKSRYLRIERSILIAKPKEEIFPYLASLEKFTIWSPWSKKDPNMKSEFQGDDMKIGSSYSWSGNKQVNTGKMTVLELLDNKFVKQELVFGKQGTAYADFTLEENKDVCKVTWGLNSDFGSFPLFRLMAPFVKKFVGKDYEEGLLELKRILEKE